jgi:hypothetical protein
MVIVFKIITRPFSAYCNLIRLPDMPDLSALAVLRSGSTDREFNADGTGLLHVVI